MGTNRRRAAGRLALAAAGTSLALIVSPAPARAADSEPARRASGVVLRVDSIRPGQSVAIEALDREMYGLAHEIVSECFGACATVVDPGRYRLRLRAADNDTIGTTVVRVQRPVAFHVVPSNPGARSVGLAMGIGGSVLAASGLISLLLVGFAGYGPPCTGETCDRQTAFLVYGAIAAPVGIITGFAGWMMFINNRLLFRREDLKASDEAGAPPVVRLGLAPERGGASADFAMPF